MKTMKPTKPKNTKRKKKPFKRGVPHRNKADKRAQENKHQDYKEENQ